MWSQLNNDWKKTKRAMREAGDDGEDWTRGDWFIAGGKQCSFRDAKKDWFEENIDSRPDLSDSMVEEIEAFRNSYEGEGKWFNSEDLMSIDQIRSEWRDEIGDWRNDKPNWGNWSV